MGRLIGDVGNRAGKWQHVSEERVLPLNRPKPPPLRKSVPTPPPVRRGFATDGRIVKLFVGQGYGFIRLTNDREIFFHRSDVREGTSFNDFVVGDSVTFELLEDTVSGARALQVKQRRRRR